MLYIILLFVNTYFTRNRLIRLNSIIASDESNTSIGNNSHFFRYKLREIPISNGMDHRFGFVDETELLYNISRNIDILEKIKLLERNPGVLDCEKAEIINDITELKGMFAGGLLRDW